MRIHLRTFGYLFTIEKVAEVSVLIINFLMYCVIITHNLPVNFFASTFLVNILREPFKESWIFSLVNSS